MSKTRQIDKIQCAKTLILSLQQVSTHTHLLFHSIIQSLICFFSLLLPRDSCFNVFCVSCSLYASFPSSCSMKCCQSWATGSIAPPPRFVESKSWPVVSLLPLVLIKSKPEMPLLCCTSKASFDFCCIALVLLHCYYFICHCREIKLQFNFLHCYLFIWLLTGPKW